MKKIHFLALLPLILCGCSVNSESVFNYYLNHKFILSRAGDIKGQDITYPYNMDRLPGYVSYINYFDAKNSYIDFRCKGNNFDNFRCETTFVLKTKEDAYIKDIEVPFNTRFTGGELGTIEIFDEKIKQELGTIYVYTPYFCRWQFEIDIDNDGNKELLTFEFMKAQFNDVPEWSD